MTPARRHMDPGAGARARVAQKLRFALRVLREAREITGPSPTDLDGAVYEAERATESAAKIAEG